MTMFLCSFFRDDEMLLINLTLRVFYVCRYYVCIYNILYVCINVIIYMFIVYDIYIFLKFYKNELNK